MNSRKKWVFDKMTKLLSEVMDHTINFKTQTFIDFNLNQKLLAFNDMLSENNYMKIDKFGEKQIASKWYEKHTQAQIEQKIGYLQDRLEILLQSDSYRATNGLVDFLNGDSNTKSYITVLIEDITDNTNFVASMNKLRYLSLVEEKKNGERPHIAIRSILNDYDCRNEARLDSECEM